MRTTITEMKKTLDGSNSRLGEAEDQFVRQGSGKHTTEQQKEKKKIKIV